MSKNISRLKSHNRGTDRGTLFQLYCHHPAVNTFCRNGLVQLPQGLYKLYSRGKHFM